MASAAIAETNVCRWLAVFCKSFFHEQYKASGARGPREYRWLEVGPDRFWEVVRRVALWDQKFARRARS